MSLSKTQKARYSRNIKINQLQESGQQKLLSAKVLVIGAGGLGSPSIYYLAAAGVGTLGIADCDVVDISNLQRQIIHSSLDIGKPKIESASEKVKRLNPEVRVITYAQKITAATINDIIKHYDFIIDCTDNFFAKFLINDACVLNSKPFSYSGVISLHGQAMTYTPGSACLRCYAPTLPETPTGNDIGILGAVAGIFGSIQAAEAIKYLTGVGSLLKNTMLYFDLIKVEYKKTEFSKNAKCPICMEY